MGEIAVMLTFAELAEIVQWGDVFMGDAPEAFADGSPGEVAYGKLQRAKATLAGYAREGL
jgi:hypothetical protein